MPGPRIIIAGAPASGKGTQCELIKEKFGVVHLSTGDMLREAAANGTDVGVLAKQFMEQGKLVPDEVIIGAVKERLAQPDCQEKGWLLDGFPRTGAQADALIEAGIKADIFILLNVPDADLIERVVGRRADPVTGKIYHLKFSPPETEEIKQRLTQRADDTEEKVKVRLQAYHDNLNAIMGKYEKIKVELNGVQNKHKIFEELAASVHKALPHLPSAPPAKPACGPRIIIAGAPASGKGTQCELIKEKFGVVHLSTGDMLREAAAKGTEVGVLAKQFMEQGKLVPDEVIIGAVKERLAQPDCEEKGWLLDGFPRTGAQADALIEAGIKADIFILLNVPDADLIERVVGRRADPVTGKIYHLKFSPPENDTILDRLTQRADDTEEKVKVRLQAYHDNLNAIMGKYEKIKVELNGTHNKNHIFSQLAAALYQSMPHLPGASDPTLPSSPNHRKSEPLNVGPLPNVPPSKGPTIIIAGAPASGKGTQCELIKEKFGVVHLSTGDMLREAAVKGTRVGLLAKRFMEEGKLVPDDVIIRAVIERLCQPDCVEKGWLLDGFPRTGAQAGALERAGAKADIFLLLNVPDADLIERVVGRRADPVTGKIYHLKFSPPETEEIKQRLTQRADDTEEKVKVRLQAYHDNLNAIIDFYGPCKAELDGTQDKHKVFDSLTLSVYSRLPHLRPSAHAKASNPNALKIIIAGAPASGKGTQCELIKEKFGVVHLSTGDMLREAAAKGTEVGVLAKQFMEQGKLVPDEVIIGAVKERLAQPDCQEKGWLLDGFPRTGAQASALINEGITADIFIMLNVPDADLIERVVGRRADPVTGKIYHLKFSPPETETIRARLTQRADDTEEKVKVRLEAFHTHMGGILGLYDRLVFRVDGTQGKTRIFETIHTRLDTLRKFEVVFVLGGPGCGKGTQCKLITSTFGYVHLSAGDLLREERNSGSETADMINSYIKEGKIVPAEVTISLLRKAMHASGKRRFLVDGFPRKLDNLEAWMEAMGGESVLGLVLYFDCPEEVMEERLLERGKTSGRSDDNAETIKKRFRTFKDETVPVLERLQRLGKVRQISAVPPPDVVFATVRRIFEGVSRVPLPERTLAMIKPDAVYHGAAAAIIASIEADDFVIVGQIKRSLTRTEAETFYAEHRGKVFFDRLINFITSGPVIALALEREQAIKAWRDLQGPTNSIKAVEEAPNSLRARFGTDGTQNATHGSDSQANAARELEFWFPDGYGRYKTLAMIKPFTATVHYEDIKSIILAHGFEIVGEAHQRVAADRVAEFYAEHEGKDFFPKLVKYMTSDTVIVLTLEREGAIRAWRMLAGPTNSIKARREKPQSIRALYGADGTINAVHGSDSIESAQREISFWFPKASLRSGKSATAQLSSHQFPEMSAYMNQVVDPVVAPIILRALVQRPANFVNFLMDELREIQRVTDTPQGMARGDLPPVKASPRGGASSPSKTNAHGAGAL